MEDLVKEYVYDNQYAIANLRKGLNLAMPLMIKWPDASKPVNDFLDDWCDDKEEEERTDRVDYPQLPAFAAWLIKLHANMEKRKAIRDAQYKAECDDDTDNDDTDNPIFDEPKDQDENDETSEKGPDKTDDQLSAENGPEKET